MSAYNLSYESQSNPPNNAGFDPLCSPRMSLLLVIQGVYFIFSGLWPLLDIFTFQLVMGPKADLWLVRTVGTLVSVIGGTLLLAGIRRRSSLEIRILAVGAALGIALIESIHVLNGRLSPGHLFDAVVELGLVSFWLTYIFQEKSGSVQAALGDSSHTTSSRPPLISCSFQTKRASLPRPF